MEFVVGTALAVIAILVTVIIFLYQERSPNIGIECRLLPDGDPSAMECVVSNTGKRAARDVYVGFTKMLPVGTTVFASPETMVELIESENPPDPNMTPNAAKLFRAFVVHVPLVVPKDTLVFTIRTTDPDNQRAAKQIMRIREEVVAVLRTFGERLTEVHPQEARNWDTGLVVSARIKEENLFVPGKFSYDKGRSPIAFISEEESRASALNQDLYARYKASFIDIYQNRPEFKAPVVRIKTESGEHTYAIFPPYVRAYIEAQVSVDKLKAQGSVLVEPPVPESYD